MKIIKLFLSVLEISAIHSRNREYQVGGTLLLCYVFRNVLRATACMLTYKQSCIKKQGILRALLFMYMLTGRAESNLHRLDFFSNLFTKLHQCVQIRFTRRVIL